MVALIKSAIFVIFVSSIGLYIYLYATKRPIRRELGKLLFSVLLYCVIISFLSPNIVTHLLAAFLTVPIFAKRRDQILPAFVFAFLTLPGISYSLSAGGTYLFVFSNFMSVTLGAMVASYLKGRPSKQSWTVPGICLIAIFSVYFLSGIRGTTATNMVRVFVDLFFNIVLPFLLVRRVVKTDDDIKKGLIGLVAACAALSALGLYEANKTWPMYRIIYDHYGVIIGNELQVKMRGGLMRAPGPFPESTAFAVWLCFGTFVAFTSRWMFRSKTMYFGMIALMIAGLFAPQSRGAWLGLIVAYVFYQIGTGKIAKMLKGVALTSVIVAMTYFAALNITQLGQMLGMNKTGTIQRDYRQDLFDRGIEESKNHLMFGTDLNSVMISLADMRQGEGIIDFVNTYLYVLLVSGLVGVSAFAFGLFAPILVLWKRAKKFRRYDTRTMSVMAALFGSLAVMLVFTSLSARTTMGVGVLLGFAAALSNMRPANLGAKQVIKRVRPRLINEDQPDQDTQIAKGVAEAT